MFQDPNLDTVLQAPDEGVSFSFDYIYIYIYICFKPPRTFFKLTPRFGGSGVV